MKNTVSIITVFLSGLFMISSCDVNQVEVDEPAIVSISFTSEKPQFNDERKTEWTGSTIQWSDDDNIRIAYTVDGVWQGKNNEDAPRLYASTKLTGSSSTASFVINTFEINVAEGEYVFYGLYPSSCVSATEFTAAPYVTVPVPAEQKPLENSFQSSADIMVAKSQPLTEFPTKIENEQEKSTSVPLTWNRLVAHAHLTLVGLPIDGEETPLRVTFTANTEADMVGDFKVDITNGTISPVSASNVLKIDATNLSIVDNDLVLWAVFMPCTWTSLNVVVETDKATYTRNIASISGGRTFKQNARNILSIDMSGATIDKKAVSDTYTVISTVNNLSEGTYYMGGNNQNTFTGSNEMYMWLGGISETQLTTSAYTFVNNTFTSDVSSVAEVELKSVSDGNSYEYYIIAGDKYLGTSGANNFSLGDTKFSWTFEDMPDNAKEGMRFYHTYDDESVCYVSINSTTNAIRGYTKATKYKGIYLFKKNE